jgi:DinB family protein
MDSASSRRRRSRARSAEARDRGHEVAARVGEVRRPCGESLAVQDVRAQAVGRQERVCQIRRVVIDPVVGLDAPPRLRPPHDDVTLILRERSVRADVIERRPVREQASPLRAAGMFSRESELLRVDHWSILGSVPFSAATALDEVRAGTPLQAIADAHSFDEIIRAVREANTAVRLGVAALDHAALRRVAGIEPWSVAMVLGHALRADEAAHEIVRTLSRGAVVSSGALGYDEPGEAAASKDQLLGRLADAEARLAALAAIAPGGPRFSHRDLGALDARGWILFVAIHDALHLHQAAAIVRTPR